MADKAADHGEALDVEKIHYLVRLMKRYDLTDLNLSDGKVQIRLKRRGPEPSNPAVPLSSLPAATQTLPTPQAPPALPLTSAAAAHEASSGPPSVVIKSPMVGTYYASSAPDSPPFVSVGSVVQPDTTIGIIEAMKVFTDIPAGTSGTITEILVKNGQPVEFDQPLFRVSSS
jgi:acetyl-CoA carboxylase biotin carboxyl carrier protein